MRFHLSLAAPSSQPEARTVSIVTQRRHGTLLQRGAYIAAVNGDIVTEANTMKGESQRGLSQEGTCQRDQTVALDAKALLQQKAESNG